MTEPRRWLLVRCEDRRPSIGFDAIPAAITTLRGVIEAVDMLRDPTAEHEISASVATADGQVVLRIAGGSGAGRMRVVDRVTLGTSAKYKSHPSNLVYGVPGYIDVLGIGEDEILEKLARATEECECWNDATR